VFIAKYKIIIENKRINIIYFLTGSGETIKYLKKLTKQLNLETQFVFLG